MPIKKLGSSFVRIGQTGWISVHVSYDGHNVSPKAHNCESTQFFITKDNPACCRLFEQTADMGLTLSERFPRLTIALIAFALLVFSVTAEIGYLTRAGYYWH